jgi:hypothetical protein
MDLIKNAEKYVSSPSALSTVRRERGESSKEKAATSH